MEGGKGCRLCFTASSCRHCRPSQWRESARVYLSLVWTVFSTSENVFNFICFMGEKISFVVPVSISSTSWLYTAALILLLSWGRHVPALVQHLLLTDLPVHHLWQGMIAHWCDGGHQADGGCFIICYPGLIQILSGSVWFASSCHLLAPGTNFSPGWVRHNPTMDSFLVQCHTSQPSLCIGVSVYCLFYL
jgi:hypothetical protein